MKITFVFGSLLLAAHMMTGCDRQDGGISGNTASVVGTWSCVTKEANVPEMSDNKTYSADGWHSSSKFPEGKKYKYRLEGDKLITTTPAGDWTAKVTRLDGGSLEYLNDKSGESKVSCKKN